MTGGEGLHGERTEHSSIKEVTMAVNRSAPRAVVPILVYEDVGKAIDWLCDTFGFRERLRAAIPGGSVTHAMDVLQIHR